MKRLEVCPDRLVGDDDLGGEVPAEHVAELRMDRLPPEVVLRDGRIGFVKANRRRDLELFGRLHRIPFVERADLWSLIADEFLDTEFDEDQRERSMRTLEDNGVSREEVAAIRRFIGGPMLLLTWATWEWVHYGLWDVLRVRPVRLLPARWIRGGAFLPRDSSANGLRRWAEAIANRAHIIRSAASLATRDDDAERSTLSSSFVSPKLGVGERRDTFQTHREALRRIQEPLMEAWSAPHRSYHGPRHLLAVLRAVERHRPHNAFILAAWFHDAVYDPTRSDNEEASALWLEKEAHALVAHGALDVADVQLAARMVRATARPLDPLPDDPQATAIRQFLDADFQVFASLPVDYDAYVGGVRQEYGFVSDDAFRAGRAAFLERLERVVLDRGHFFYESSPLAEWLAHQNLKRELAQLRG